MIIAVDVDQTVVNLTDKWIEWLNNVFNTKFYSTYDNMFYECFNIENSNRKPLYNYDLHKYHGSNHSVNGLDFFIQSDLYDDQQPIQNSVEMLKKIYLLGHDIIFVSHCFSGHLDSKKKFIEKYFPFAKAFIATSDKKYVNADIIIDDRIKYIHQHPSSVKIVMLTPFKQDKSYIHVFDNLEINKFKNGYFLAYDWESLYSFICNSEVTTQINLIYCA